MAKNNKQSATAPSAMKDVFSDAANPIKPGQIIEGEVIEINKANIFIDFKSLGVGIILGKEIKEHPSLTKELKIGQTVSCLVLEPENEKGYIEVSLKEADKELSWEKLEKLKENGETVSARITQANRGGLIVSLMGQEGFLPASQLSSENYPSVEGGDKDKILQELNKLVGKELSVKVIDLSQPENKLIVSEKALNKEEIMEIMDYFKIGEVFEGKVSTVTDFGAFVKLSGGKEAEKLSAPEPEGLIHISELDWKLVKDPREIVKEGETVKVKIIGYHQGRPSLSLKALKEKPQEQPGPATEDGNTT